MSESTTVGAEANGNLRIELPKPSGPYAVGIVGFELTDNGREETFAPGEKRRIPAKAWYPAAEVSGLPRPYASDREFELQVEPFCTKVLGLEPAIADAFRVSSHSYENAPAAELSSCPTLVFSHGGMSFLQQNTALMEHLASYGYVVVSINHPYVSMKSIYADGTVARFADEVLQAATDDIANPMTMDEYTAPDIARRLECRRWSANQTALVPHFKEWVLDTLFAIECLASRSLPESAQTIIPLIDTDRIGTFGMSLGCSATVAAHLDDRVKATVNLDGGVFDDRLIDTDISVPIMVISNDMKSLAPDNDQVNLCEFTYEKLQRMGEREDVQRFKVNGVSHIGVSDFVLIPEQLRKDSPALGHHLGSIDGQTMVSIMNDFVKAFFDQRLSGVGSGIDESLLNKYPECKAVDLSYVRDWAIKALDQ